MAKAKAKPPDKKPVSKPLSGDSIPVFLNFRMDVAVYQALKSAAIRDGVTVEQMTHRVLAHSLGFEVPL